jgi:hypothetical protein
MVQELAFYVLHDQCDLTNALVRGPPDIPLDILYNQ